MRLRLQVVMESDTGEIVATEEVAQLERHSLQPEEVGLTLTDAKQILAHVQRLLVQGQVAEFLTQRSRCADCDQTLSRKGQHHIVFRTVFGTLRLPSPRFYSCACQQVDQTSFSPLAEKLPERIAPELVYLETKFAALLSYGLSVDILREILPIGDTLN